MAPPQMAKVKSVLSGDTVILTSLNNSKLERTLSLAYVTAPRLRREGDETYAVESRDYLRRRLVGKVVQFKTLYTLPTGTKREYGTIVLQDGHTLPETAVLEGALKVREDAGRREESEEATALIERLRVLEAKAKSDEKGIWDTSASTVNTSYELSDPQKFLDQFKGKPITSVVEKVLTGDRLIVRLMTTPTDHIQTMLLIAGARAPSTKRVNPADGSEQPAEPFGEEAHEFVESRLLQRGVEITPLGLSPQNQIIGTVKHPNGDIAIFLLQAGLARCVDFHATLLGQSMSGMRQAEKQARDKQLGIFRGAAAPRASGKESQVTVSRVQSADTLFLRYADGTERRVNLSSVRQPKPSDPKQSPFGADAKEWARKKLIGKHVNVVIDGKRPATEGFDERVMATVTQNGKNIALALVEAGYASVIRHRMDDPDRSPIYDDLLLAEDAAQKEGIGMWSAKAPEAKAYVDYSESLEKAKRLLTLLARQKRVPAIVDFVKGSSRFALLIPRENAKITLVLSGINAPKSARNANEASEPFGKEAHELATRRCQQRDVEVDVEDNDKVGGFIGKLYVNGENFARTLLEHGYATVREYSAEKSGNASELFAAEQKAKDARKGVWQDYDPSQDAAATESTELEASKPTNGASNGDAAPAASFSKDYRDIQITHVEPTCRLQFQQISPSTSGALQALEKAFRSFHLSQSSGNLTAAPKVGEYVAAKFSLDGLWYRARVRRNDRENKTSEILFVDYGNKEMKPWAQMRPLSQSQFNTTALKTQAQEAALSFVQFPSGNENYMAEAQDWLEQRLGQSGNVIARVDFTDQRDGTLHISLFDEKTATGDSGASINAELVDEGFAMVARKPQRWEKAHAGFMAALAKKEEAARSERRGMWEYGDPTGEE